MSHDILTCMSPRTIASDVVFPKPWPRAARSAVIQAISLASTAVTMVRARAISSGIARLLQSTEIERLRNEILLLREELRIKDCRMASLPHRAGHATSPSSAWRSSN